MSYDKVYNFWKKNPELYWKKKLSLIDWYKPFTKKFLSQDEDKTTLWFKDGELNTCYNCLDRHVKNGLANKNAIIYDSPISKTEKNLFHIINYFQM